MILACRPVSRKGYSQSYNHRAIDIVTSSHRLAILSAQEVDELYGLPRFTEEDRQLYFDFSAAELEAITARTFAVGLYLALELGYFKAKRQFFNFNQTDVHGDIGHLVERYFPERKGDSTKPPSRPTRLVIQKAVLELLDYHLCNADAKEALEQKALRVAALSTQPHYILRESLQYLSNHRIVAPLYSSLQDMIGRVVNHERNRVLELLATSAPSVVLEQLDHLLEADDQMYRVSALKREPKNFSHGELKREVARRQYFEPLHDFARTFLQTAGLSNESGKYYASLVKFYTVYKLRRMPIGPARLYLLCFAFLRFREINDNLIEAFVYLVDHYEKLAKRAADEAMKKAMDDASENLQAAGDVLTLFVDDSIAANTPFQDVQHRAFGYLQRETIPAVADYLRNIEFDKAKAEWAYYTSLSMTIKRNLRHLFSELEFAGRVEDAPLMGAVAHLQEVLRQGKSPRQINPDLFMDSIISKSLRPYLYSRISNGEEEVLDVDRYEFHVYRMLRNALESGDLFVRNSNEFRPFEDDLISDERWKNKEAILREIDSPVLTRPIEETLAIFREALESRFSEVNQRILDCRNEHIKVRGRGERRRWSLIYPAQEEPLNSPFYSRLPGIGIADLLAFVGAKTGFLGQFTHVLDRYVKHDLDPRKVLACVVAMGTNMGLAKMAEVSGMSYASLATTAKNFLRPETLRAANDAVSNAVAALPVFHLYDIRDELHSSSDGQRIETQIDTFNARHSPKYFGLDKGVSACTVVANHVPINGRIIGTHEHESHYVFDLLYNNTSDIKPDRHSTDTHGTNQVNFWTLYAYGYGFAPRYRDLHKKTERLVGFFNPSQYASDFLIRPSRKAQEDLIVREWPNIQRIMASLGQKDTTQATIIRKLSSYARQNQTKKALWELDNICRSIYILDFIDDVGLRQSVQKALNRGEAYHRFRKAVAYVNGGRFRVQTESEQQVWNDCSRLIANAIIYYNTMLLSKVYEQKLVAGDEAAISVIKGISPVAWQHINLIGRFEFSDTIPMIDIDGLASRYADQAFWNETVAGVRQESPAS